MLLFLNKYILGPALPAVVFVAGVYLLYKCRFFIFTKTADIVKIMRGKGEKKGMSPFKTAMLALASTLGVGNIVGVSTAIYSGGAGAVFWMTFSAFVAMSLQYAEVFLAVKYREKEGSGYKGGAMYYIQRITGSRTHAMIFAFLCIINALTVGNVIQINAASETMKCIFSSDPLIFGVCACIIIFLSVKKGADRISRITSMLIPAVSVAYILLSFFVLAKNVSQIGNVLSLIFKEAFSARSVLGGVGGYSIARAIRYGFARGIMSNEAGSGTSPIAHAKTALKSPVEQGIWGIFEVFADTVVMCNLTAFVILLSYNELVVSKGLTGMELVLASYGKYAGAVSDYLIPVCVILFAYATVISQGFYGSECVGYIFGKTKGIGVFFVLYSLISVLGAVINSSSMWEFTDFNIAVMTIINTLCVLKGGEEVKKLTLNYFYAKKQSSKNNCSDTFMDSGKISPATPRSKKLR